jgi:hypothetical protein
MITQISLARPAILALAALLTATPHSGFGQGAAPGPEHQALKRHEGEWTATVKMGDTESPGTMTLKMECGGLWLMSDFHSEFGGQKFHGRGMDGYDVTKQKYVSVWVDSMNTQPMFMEGDFDKEKKTLTMTGAGPGMDGKPAKFKGVTHYPDDDHQTFTMYVIDAEGKENKVMTIDYVRKK